MRSRVVLSILALIIVIGLVGCGTGTSGSSTAAGAGYSQADEQQTCAANTGTNHVLCTEIYHCLQAQGAPYSDVEYIRATAANALNPDKISNIGKKCLSTIATQAQSSLVGGGTYQGQGVQQSFVKSCVGNGASSSSCESAYSCLSSHVAFSNYLLFTQAVADNTTANLNQGVLDNIKSCLSLLKQK